MSLLPFILSDPSAISRPSQILDQHFGLGLNAEDLLTPLMIVPEVRALLRSPRYIRPWKATAAAQDIGSTVSVDKYKFQINLDVQHFTPEEITVKAAGDNSIIVEAKHEEKEDEHGFISRHFRRRYFLPKGHDLEKVVSNLSSDGVLTITAPKVDAEQVEHREIPVVETGVPAKKLENNKTQQEQQVNGS